MSRIRPLVMRLGLALLAVVLTVGALELIFRSFVPSSTHHLMYRPSDDPQLRVELIPGADFEFEGVAVPIPATRVLVSSQGLRDDTVEIPKPAGVKRLLCVGDSTTFGWGVQAEEAFCQRLQGFLPGWETINLGVPGYNTMQEVRRLEVVGIPLEPDLVVLLFDGNDLQPPIVYGGSGPSTWLLDRSALVRWVAARLKTTGDEEQGQDEGRDHAGAGPDDPFADWDGEAEVLKAFARLDQLRAREGFKLLVLLPSDDENRALESMLKARGIANENIRHALRGTQPGDEMMIPDDGHPNAQGHERIAKAIATLLHQRGLVGAD